MNETKEDKQYWQNELVKLRELRDSADKIQNGLNYTYSLLSSIKKHLPDINQSQEKLKTLPKMQQDVILKERRKIIQSLCERVTVHSNGEIVIEGMIDSERLSSFGTMVTRRDNCR